MQFGYIGINYVNTQLDIREKTFFTDVKKMNLLQGAEKIGICQCMILSTCNRSEIYFLYKGETQFSHMKYLYKSLFKELDLDPYLFMLRGMEAIKYLFRVSAGLESLVMGEDQILGQVKDALDFSRTMGFAKKEMNKIVRDAVTCSKKIKTELKISEKPLSVSYVGIQQLEKTCGIAGKTILIIGSGKMSLLALRYVYEYGAKKVMVCSRALVHAKELKSEFPIIEVVQYEQRYKAMEICDIVISATSSPHRVVTKEGLVVKRPMTLLDLATPRDVDVELANVEDVHLINLDTLQQIVAKNQLERQYLLEISRDMIDEAIEETRDWLLSSRMDTTIESLQKRCEEIVDDSYDYLSHKIDLTDRQKLILRKVINASLQRLLKEPIQELKQLDSREKQEEYETIIKELFQL